MDNPFPANRQTFPHPRHHRRPAVRCFRFRRASRAWIVGPALLAFAAGAFAQSQPSIAPDGKFLPNDPYILPTPPVHKLFGIAPPQLPPPNCKYETRLGWLIGANTDYHSFWGIQGESTEQDFSRVIYKEMQRVSKLKGEPRQKYILALIRDFGTLEITDLDNRATTQIIKAAIFDFLAGSAGSAALGAASVKGLKEYATGGMTSGLADLLSQAIKKPLSTSKIRLALLEQYIKERCGCLFPLEGQFRSGPAWREPVIPNVRGKYQTHLGRLVACGGKLQSGAFDRRQQYAQQELAKLTKLKKEKPSQFLAYLVNFSYDIETMQEELLEDQHAFSDTNFLIGLGLGAIAAATGPALLAAGPAAASTATVFYEKAFEAVVGSMPGAMLSAGYTGTVEMSSYPYEKQLLVGIAGLRRTVLQSISRLPGDCGCKEKKAEPEKDLSTIVFQEQRNEGYWLAVVGDRLEIDYGDEMHMVLKHGREAILEGPMFMSQGEAVDAVCSRISNRRIERAWPRNGYYGDYKGQTYFIGSLGNCGDKISDERRP